MIKDIINLIKSVLRVFWYTLKGPYKWLLIFFCIWDYRIGYIPADSGGVAKAVQVISTIGILLCIFKYSRSRVVHLFTANSIGLRLISLLYVYATVVACFSELPQFAFFLSVQNVVILMMFFWIFSIPKTFVSMEKLFLYMYVGFMMAQIICMRSTTVWELFVHDLSSGSCSALIISYCAGELLGMKYKDTQRRSLLRSVLILAVINIVLCTSSGANLSAVFGISIALFFSGKLGYASLLALIALFFYINQDMAQSVLYFLMPGKSVQTFETATGRDRIWKGILKVAEDYKIIGAGLGCAERIAFERDYIPVSQPDPHSNYIGIYANLGIIGCMIAAFHFFTAGVYSLKHRMKPGYAGILAAIGCALLNGYTYGFLAAKTCGITIVYFAFMVLMYYYSRIKIYDSRS